MRHSKLILNCYARVLVAACMLLVGLPAVCEAQAVRDRALYLVVEPGQGIPEAATLQLALERELDVVVRLGTAQAAGDAVLSVRPAGSGRATVEFRAPDGHVTGRAVVLPTELARAAETVALLAANLVGNEAAELLGELRRSRAVVAQPAPAEATPASAVDEPTTAVVLDPDVTADAVPEYGFTPPEGQVSSRRAEIAAWVQESGLVLAGVQLGISVVHTVLAVGAFQQDQSWKPAAALGFGLRLRLSQRWHLDFDALDHVLFTTREPKGKMPAQLAQLRALVGAQVLGRLSVFAGPTWNVLIAPDDRDILGEGVLVEAPDGPQRVRVRLWAGVLLGVAGF